jgi:hypothetical protein
VDEHYERLLGHLCQCGRHRVRSRGAAGHAGDDLRRGQLLREEDRGLLPTGRRSDDDRVDQRTALEPIDALGEEWAPTESGERLGSVDPEPLARAGGGDQRPDISAGGGNVSKPPLTVSALRR